MKLLANVSEASGMDVCERSYFVKGSSVQDILYKICKKELGKGEHDFQKCGNVYLVDGDSIAIELVDIKDLEVI